MRSLSIETTTHGRVLIEDSLVKSPRRLLVGFHGYAQNADEMLSELKQLPGSEEWALVSIQGLHRFYARGSNEKVVASWMTREDRELAIADNIAYVNRVVDSVLSGVQNASIVYIGFSQGVATAYRAAVLGAHRAALVIAVGGDVPPDVQTAPVSRFPEVLVAAGENDVWYSGDRFAADERFLRSHGVHLHLFRYGAGHEFTDELRAHIGDVLKKLP
jgi:predicted esterase